MGSVRHVGTEMDRERIRTEMGEGRGRRRVVGGWNYSVVMSWNWVFLVSAIVELRSPTAAALTMDRRWKKASGAIR